jgi:hypothetical protein
MFRTLIFSALIAAGLTGVAAAAEPGQPLVNRPEDGNVFAGRNNLVGGSSRNSDGSVTFSQGIHRPDVDAGYTQPPVAAYEGN